MKKVFLVILCLLVLTGCTKKPIMSISDTSQTENTSIISSTIENNASNIGSKSSELVEGTKEWFFSHFKESNFENNDESTEFILGIIKPSLPSLFDSNVADFNLDKDEFWFKNLGIGFGYFEKNFKKNTNGYLMGYYGLECLYALYSRDSASFGYYLPKVKEIVKDIWVDIDTNTYNNKITDGQYKIGTDIPEGEYAIFSNTGNGYYCVSSDPNEDDILFNDGVHTNAFVYVKNGEYLSLSSCYAVPLSENEITIDTSKEGMFRVGIDIESGEYKIVAEQNKSGYYCIYPDSRQTKILSNDLFTTSSYVKVKEGQYLVLNDCHIEK